MNFSDMKTLNIGSGLLEIHIPSLNISFLDSIRYLPGPLKNLSKRFCLELSKGDFPHVFTKKENFSYCGPCPADNYFLSFGQTSLDDNTKQYLAERRAANEDWHFGTEMYKYNCADVKILRESCSKFVEQNFSFQEKLIQRFGRVNPKNKLPHLHAFSPPFVTLASFSYGCLRAWGTHKVQNKMFAVMGKNNFQKGN